MRKGSMIAAAALAACLGAAHAGCAEEGGLGLAGDLAFQGIVGGEETNYEIYKGVVGLYFPISSTQGALCTATVIDPQVLLTAGHCVYSPGEEIDAVSDPGALMVVGGADLNTMGGDHVYPDAVEVVTHPDWSGNIDYSSVDLAMIRLEAPIDTTETYRVRREDDFEEGDTGIIVGYGLASSSEPTSAGVHRWGETTVLNKLMHYVNLGDPAGTCQGDSGGPFFTMVDDYWHVTGVTSLGLSSECDPMSGSVDVNVTQFVDWIDETLNGFVGYGLDDVPHQDPPGDDTDTGADTDADTDADSDADTDADTDAADGGLASPPDDSCDCAAAGAAPAGAALLAAIL